MMPQSPRWPEILVRIYRMLIRAYPASFRREYGSEMTEVFRDLAQEAWQERGVIGLALLWLRTVPDFLLSGAAQHLHETRRRIAMAKVLLDPAYCVLALAMVLFVAALVTPADPYSMMLVGFPLYGVYLCVMIAARRSRAARGAGDGTADSTSREERIA